MIDRLIFLTQTPPKTSITQRLRTDLDINNTNLSEYRMVKIYNLEAGSQKVRWAFLQKAKGSCSRIHNNFRVFWYKMYANNILNSKRNASLICIYCSQKNYSAIAMLSVDIMSWNFVCYFLTHRAAIQWNFGIFTNISFRDCKKRFFTQKHNFS